MASQIAAFGRWGKGEVVDEGKVLGFCWRPLMAEAAMRGPIGWSLASALGLLAAVLCLYAFNKSQRPIATPLAANEFRDCADCPVMVRVPGGAFRMGDISGDRRMNEKPVHDVTLSTFAVGKFEVTWAEWEACVRARTCALNKGGFGPDHGWGRGTRPVIRVSWYDAKAYIAWLNTKTPGARYRLLTEAEWEYAARAGADTAYSWGEQVGVGNANCRGCGVPNKATYPVGSFAPNAFGLHDMHGNLSEWVEDCFHETYTGAPNDGSAWAGGNCTQRMLRGGSWMDAPSDVRASSRRWNAPSQTSSLTGFRLARTL